MPRQIGRSSILLTALGACEFGPVWLGRLFVRHSSTIAAIAAAAAATTAAAAAAATATAAAAATDAADAADAAASFRSTIRHEEGLVSIGDSLAAGAGAVKGWT